MSITHGTLLILRYRHTGTSTRNTTPGSRVFQDLVFGRLAKFIWDRVPIRDMSSTLSRVTYRCPEKTTSGGWSSRTGEGVRQLTLAITVFYGGLNSCLIRGPLDPYLVLSSFPGPRCRTSPSPTVSRPQLRSKTHTL